MTRKNSLRSIIDYGTVCGVPLTQGYVARIDRQDATIAGMFNWYTVINRGKPYAYRSVFIGTVRANIPLHRQVVGMLPRGVVVDHINGDTLDNRRENLRGCTVAQNIQRGPRRPPASGYRGVYLKLRKDGSRAWGARCADFHLGYFPSPEDAARAVNTTALERWGPLAWIESIQREDTDDDE